MFRHVVDFTEVKRYPLFIGRISLSLSLPPPLSLAVWKFLCSKKKKKVHSFIHSCFIHYVCHRRDRRCYCCVFSPTAFMLVVCTHMRSRDVRSLIHLWASAYTTSSTHTQLQWIRCSFNSPLLTTIAVTGRIGIVFCDNVNKLMMRVYYFFLSVA